MGDLRLSWRALVIYQKQKIPTNDLMIRFRSELNLISAAFWWQILFHIYQFIQCILKCSYLHTTFCPVRVEYSDFHARILELVTSRMIKLGQKLIGMHMDASLEEEKSSVLDGRAGWISQWLLDFQGFPKSWDDFISFGEMISEIISNWTIR